MGESKAVRTHAEFVDKRGALKEVRREVMDLRFTISTSLSEKEGGAVLRVEVFDSRYNRKQAQEIIDKSNVNLELVECSGISSHSYTRVLKIN